MSNGNITGIKRSNDNQDESPTYILNLWKWIMSSIFIYPTNNHEDNIGIGTEETPPTDTALNARHSTATTWDQTEVIPSTPTGWIYYLSKVQLQQQLEYDLDRQCTVPELQSRLTNRIRNPLNYNTEQLSPTKNDTPPALPLSNWTTFEKYLDY